MIRVAGRGFDNGGGGDGDDGVLLTNPSKSRTAHCPKLMCCREISAFWYVGMQTM